MIYADFNFYRDNFFGKLIPENDFSHYAQKASKYLDAVTFGRIGDDVTDDIRCACCAAAEEYFSCAGSAENAAGISSEKVGDYSVQYAAAKSSGTQSKRLRAAVEVWLANSGLLFRGCD